MYYETLILALNLVNKEYLHVKIYKIEDDKEARKLTNNYKDHEAIESVITDHLSFKFKGTTEEINKHIDENIISYLSATIFVDEQCLTHIVKEIKDKYFNLTNYTIYSNKINVVVEDISNIYIAQNKELHKSIMETFRTFMATADESNSFDELSKMLKDILNKYEVNLFPHILFNGDNFRIRFTNKDLGNELEKE